MALTIFTDPAKEPISVNEAKRQCRVDIADDDVWFTAAIQAARETAETLSGWKLITQTWKYIFNAWPAADRLEIPYPPLQSVASITYKDQDGNASTFSADDYIVDADSMPGRIVLATGASWPGGTLYPVGAITLQFTCGYGDDESDVPRQLRQGVLLLIGHWYENREDTVSVGTIQRIPLGAMDLFSFNRFKEF